MMSTRYVYSVIVAVSLSAHFKPLEAAAGMRITVAESTLKMVNEAEISALKRDLNGKRFNDLSGGGDLSWRLSDIRVQYLGTMTSSINLLSYGQIRWSCYISSITVKADWWARLKGWLGSISDDGSVTATAGRTSLGISLTLSENSGGLGISLSSCSASVGSFNLDFRGSLLSGLLNIISGVFERDIKRSLADSICDFVRKGMDDITADMRNIKTSLPIEIIGIPLTLDNSFTQVTVNSNTISTYHKAAVRWNGGTFYSADTTALPTTSLSRGIAFDLKEDVVNNLLRAYVESGRLDGSFDYSRVVKNDWDEFRLTCKTGTGTSSICFGNIVRQVAKEYPDRVLGMQWNVHTANLNIREGQIKGELTGRVNCSADSATESLPLFSAQVELIVAFQLKFSAGELSARSVAWGGHATIDRSNIGKVMTPAVLDATNLFFLPAIQKDILAIISEFKTSYKLELPKNVFIKESGLRLYEGVVRVEADLCYKTTACRSKTNDVWVGNKDVRKFIVDDIVPTTTTKTTTTKTTTTTTTTPSSTTTTISLSVTDGQISGQASVVFSIVNIFICLAIFLAVIV